MAQVIVYTNDDGGVSIIIPVLGRNAYNETTGEWLPLKEGQSLPDGFRAPTVSEIANKDVPNGRAYFIIDESALPARDKREAWVLQNGEVVIDEARVKIDYIQMMRDMVRDIDPAVLMRYPGHIGLIGQFLDAGSVPQAIGLIQALAAIIGNASDTEAETEIDKVLALLQQAGLIQG